MSNFSLTNFTADYGQITSLVKEDGSIWFHASQLLANTGTKTTTTQAKTTIEERLGDGHNILIPISDSLGRTQETLFFSEAAATWYLSRSRTEAGKALDRKLHVEILPQIRKTGAYQPTNLAEWQEGRLKGKAVRRSLTDTIKIFCQYAEAQGSGNADRYYIHFSSLLNKYIIEGYPSAVKGIKDKRDRMSHQQLRYVAVIEEAISKLIDDRMMAGDDYHRVYEEAKARVAAIAAVLDIEPKPLLPESNKTLINQSLARALKAATA
jgi:prophage antirepressor-like protein